MLIEDTTRSTDRSSKGRAATSATRKLTRSASSRSGVGRGGGAGDHLRGEVDAGYRHVWALGRDHQRYGAGSGADVEHEGAGWQPGGGDVGDHPTVQRPGEDAGPPLVVAGVTSQPVHVGPVVRVVM